MMVDGQPQFAGIYSHSVSDFYSKSYVDRVEVLRGPGSVLYGSNAMAGVVNVITRQPGQDTHSLSLESKYGSYNTSLTSLTATAKRGRLSTLVSVNYDRTDGVADNFDFKQWEGYARMGYDISSHWNASADFTLQRFTANDPIYAKLKNPSSTDIYHQTIVRGEGSLKAINRYENVSGAAQVYYSYGNHYIDDPRHFHSLDDRLGVLLYENVHLWEGGEATAGFDFNTYSGKIPMSGGKEHSENSIQTIGRKTVTEYSPYLTYAQSFFDDQLTLNGGIRMANSDKFGTTWVPQAGVSFNHRATGLRAKASVAEGYRNPSFRELYLYKMANPDLNPEQTTNYEFTVGKNFGRWFDIELTGYIIEGRYMIDVYRMQNVNTGSFTNKGIEVSAKSHPVSSLMLYATYSYLHTSLDNLTGAPRNQYFLGADWKAFRNLSISATLKGVSGLFVDADVPTQNYATFGLKAEFAPVKWLTLVLEGENLTDARYEINRGYKMPGATVMGGFRLTL